MALGRLLKVSHINLKPVSWTTETVVIQSSIGIVVWSGYNEWGVQIVAGSSYWFYEIAHKIFNQVCSLRVFTRNLA